MKERMADGREDKVSEASIAYEICGRHETEFSCTASFRGFKPWLYRPTGQLQKIVSRSVS
jgi:hypothetical protein